ncbi:MAG: FAD-dependent thymidylate synthase [Cyanobacteria bacterium P01_F01_bin.3]
MTNAQILADSLNTATGDRLTTFLLPRFPKCLLAELNTHRMLSRNAASSRAIPIERMVERIEADPYIPLWTASQKGMQGVVIEDDALIKTLTDGWLEAFRSMAERAIAFHEYGVHKQNANRILEPWMRVPVIVSGTEWDNFFALRCDEACHPDFRSVAREMNELYESNEPTDLAPGQWHVPFAGDGLWVHSGNSIIRECDALKIAVARCARISYTSHDGDHSVEKDFALHDRLLESRHMSPFEHCAFAVAQRNKGHWYQDYSNPPLRPSHHPSLLYTRNYRGFYSYRAHIEDGVSV